MRSVEIECQMLAVCGDQFVTLTASGKTGVLRCPQWRGSRYVLRALSLLLESKDLIRQLHGHCLAQQMSLTLELCERAVLQIGHTAKPGLVSRILGLYPVEIKTIPLCIALLKSVRKGR